MRPEVKPIGLGAPGAPVDLDARGVDHDVVDALLDQPAVQPPAVAARLVTAEKRRLLFNAKSLTRSSNLHFHGFPVFRVDCR